MADKNNKWEENKAGKFYVDRTCIACDACVMTSPGNFEMHEDDGHAYVSRQPTNQLELHLCIEAQNGCPVDAIGSDGE